jgi:hypothetical protein
MNTNLGRMDFDSFSFAKIKLDKEEVTLFETIDLQNNYVSWFVDLMMVR